VAVRPESPTVVVLRALGLGDLLTALPALRALAGHFPRHHRVLAAPAALAPLAHHSGAIDEVVDTAGLGIPLDARLAGAGVAVNLHGRGPQSHELLAAIRPRRLIAFANPAVPGSAGGPRWRPGEHEVSRWCRLLRESGIPADPRRLDLAPPPGAPPDGSAGATLVHPGASSAARRWPPERFAAVARAEAERGRAVVISGGPGEAEPARAVAELAGRPPRLTVNAAGGGLLELASLVAAAGRVVCGDTGVAHLATALGRPSVVLFGPVSPAEWGPPPERSWHRVLWKRSTGDPHAPEPHPGLLEITVSEVLQALDDLRDRPRRAQGAQRWGPAAVA
jgi:ADP-heptose:LPS heptosyltransferase